jgi:hypothetical protein
MDAREYSRFLQRVNKNGTIKKPELGCCWEWTLALCVTGYGRFCSKNKTYAAHRWSFMYHKGEIPVGKLIRHACDNPKCVNPDHLSYGTQQENMNDLKEKVRLMKGEPEVNKDTMGENNGRSKLTADDVREIRVLKGFAFNHVELGKMYGVNESAVRNILAGRTWKHVV